LHPNPTAIGGSHPKVPSTPSIDEPDLAATPVEVGGLRYICNSPPTKWLLTSS
jgi:hypothetical protein